MGTSPVRLAKCCCNCRQYRRKSWVQMKVSICALTGDRITQVAYCPRFRWAAGCRPPTPPKAAPAAIPIHEILPPEEVSR
ncbi:MAG TPA: hypothetical protein VM537_27060 [Anaerolineae bacterium]|nr:hypothetical protein [Anaerolineae bacterium]